MKILSRRFRSRSRCWRFQLSPSAALAQSQTGLDHRTIPHRVNPSPLGAATTSTTGSLSPITYHGGPVMGTPVVYLIWYGNWNQNNGSDTPARQRSSPDFLV